MCGIAGYIKKQGIINENIVKEMTREMIYRGPDSEGYHFSAGVGIGIRRLKIIDLNTGDQPIHNEDKTVWTVFNGEVYNYKLLRRKLEDKGHEFYTQSDTEVIVHLYEEYGEDFVTHLNGMFGLAVWDEKLQKLLVARDRAGEKEIYYHLNNGEFSFSSELKSLFKNPAIKKSLNQEAFHYYLMLGRVPAPYSIFEDIYKLEPAELLILVDGKYTKRKYWQLSFANKLIGNENEIKKQLINKFEQSVVARMESDVPLGAFLSGGVDSSAVVAMMAQNSSSPIKTFSVGFEDKDFSELSYAKIVADQLKTDHHEFILKPDILDELPKLAWHLDEPFADYSIIPSYFISRQTRNHVTVALTGDGADELFAGYELYRALVIANYYNKLPNIFKQACYQLAKILPDNDEREKIIRYLHKFKRLAVTQRDSGDMLKSFLNMSAGFSEQELFSDVYHDSLSNKMKLYSSEKLRRDVVNEYDGDNEIEAILYSQFKTLLPDMFFHKTDRCSMAVSLETRSPFVDHEFISLVAKIPFNLKLKGLTTKYILKESLKGILPAEVLFRHKKGFTLPLSRWMRDTKNLDNIKQVVLDKGLLTNNFFNESYINKLFTDYEGKVNYNFDKLWRIYMFSLWYKNFMN